MLSVCAIPHPGLAASGVSLGLHTQIVGVKLPLDRDGSRHRGFGYVEFTDAQGLTSALGLSGAELVGRSVRISVAAPPRPRREEGRDPMQQQQQTQGAQGPPTMATGGSGGGGGSSGATSMPGVEPAFFFELQETGRMVTLVRVVDGVTFSDDELSPAAHRLLSRQSTSDAFVLCKVMEAQSGLADATTGSGGHGEYMNVNIDHTLLANAARSHVQSAGMYGAGIAVTITFGRMGVVAPQSMVGVPMLPERLCDLLADTSRSAYFFAPEMGGQPEVDAAKATMETQAWGVDAQSVRYRAAYLDGHQCVLSVGPDGALLGLDPTEDDVKQAMAESGRNRDPYLRGKDLQSRVASMTLEESGRIALPPPPTGSKDVRTFGALCLDNQVNEEETVFSLAQFGDSSSSPLAASKALKAWASTAKFMDFVDPSVPTYRLKPDFERSR